MERKDGNIEQPPKGIPKMEKRKYSIHYEQRLTTTK